MAKCCVVFPQSPFEDLTAFRVRHVLLLISILTSNAPGQWFRMASSVSPLWTYHTWWRHQMETFSALLAICAGIHRSPGEFPAQRSVTRSFDVFFDLRLNKRLSKQSWGWWFEALSWPLWRHCNDAKLYASLRAFNPIHDIIIYYAKCGRLAKTCAYFPEISSVISFWQRDGKQRYI